MSDQWCTVAIDHTTETEPSESGTSSAAPLAYRTFAEMPGEKSGDPEHDGRRVDSGDRRTQSGRVADRDSGATPDVENSVARTHTAQSHGKLRIALATEGHAERGDKPCDTPKTGIVGVVIGWCLLLVHMSTLTVEPDFKSSGSMSETC